MENVEIYEEEREDGRFLKSIKFRFPVYYNGAETQELDLSDSSCDYQMSIVLPKSLTTIEAGTFRNCDALESITIPESVTSIAKSIFIDISEEPTIYGKAGSYAETFAKEKGYTFVAE